MSSTTSTTTIRNKKTRARCAIEGCTKCAYYCAWDDGQDRPSAPQVCFGHRTDILKYHSERWCEIGRKSCTTVASDRSGLAGGVPCCVGCRKRYLFERAAQAFPKRSFDSYSED